MKSALLLLLLGLLLSRVGYAQLYTYHVSGEAFLKNKATLLPLRPRMAVREGQALVLKPGAQVVLLDAKGRNISYTKVGQATYATLQQAFEASATTTGRAYMAYVWNSMQQQERTPAQLGNAPLGGVARGDAPAQLAPADSAVQDQPLVAFEWQVPAGSPPAWFTVLDAAGEPLLQLRTAAARLEVQTALTGLKRNTVYYWVVSASAESAGNAPRRAFLIANAESQRQFAQELTGLPAIAETQSWTRRYRSHWFFAHARK